MIDTVACEVFYFQTSFRKLSTKQYFMPEVTDGNEEPQVFGSPTLLVLLAIASKTSKVGDPKTCTNVLT